MTDSDLHESTVGKLAELFSIATELGASDVVIHKRSLWVMHGGPIEIPSALAHDLLLTDAETSHALDLVGAGDRGVVEAEGFRGQSSGRRDPLVFKILRDPVETPNVQFLNVAPLVTRML